MALCSLFMVSFFKHLSSEVSQGANQCSNWPGIPVHTTHLPQGILGDPAELHQPVPIGCWVLLSVVRGRAHLQTAVPVRQALLLLDLRQACQVKRCSFFSSIFYSKGSNSRGEKSAMHLKKK